MPRRHHNLQLALNKLYVIRKIARNNADRRLELLVNGAIRELEDLRGEALDLNTWLANNQGLYNAYGDIGFATDYQDDDTDDSENTD